MTAEGELEVFGDEPEEFDLYACDACLAAEDICVFHQGFAKGWDACVAAVAGSMADDDVGDAA
jgi:hypothetical protein